MNYLIVPCLGRLIVDGLPQYLQRHPDGKLLFEKSIEGLPKDIYDRIIVAVLQNDIESYRADKAIMESLTKAYPISFHVFSSLTSGPAETIYRTIKECNLNGSIIVKDCDNYICLSEKPIGNFVVGLDINTWKEEIFFLKQKSFLIINEQNTILDIIEKQIKSSIISLGLYGFNNSEDFVCSYERLSDVNYHIDKLYVSHIISYLIGYNERIFRYISASNYENWGNVSLWNKIKKDRSIYFISYDAFFVTNEMIIDDNKKTRLYFLQRQGAFFVWFTSLDEAERNHIEDRLRRQGLNVKQIIFNCPMFVEKTIIDSIESLEKAITL